MRNLTCSVRYQFLRFFALVFVGVALAGCDGSGSGDRDAGVAINAGSDVTRVFGDAPFTQAATGGNGGALSYSSSNTAVATVDSATGLVTLVGAGSATITATEAEGANYLEQSDSYALTVNKGAGVALNAGADVSKAFGDAPFTQAATGGNGGALSYSSSDTAVATVDSAGLVTLVGVGSATITATEAEGANYLGQSDSYALTVNKAVNKGAGVALNAGADVSKAFGDAPYTQAATGGNGGALSYSSSNTAVATVDSTTGLVTLVGAGSATITATEAGGANYLGQIASYTLTVNKGVGVALDAGADVTRVFVENATFTQAATGGNGGALSYSSSNTAVATVDSAGLVTLKAYGDTIITVTEAEGANYLGQSDNYKVTVGENRVLAIIPNEKSFAALRENGSIFAWGSSDGGTTHFNTVAPLLSGSNAKVVSVIGSADMFAALHDDGSVTKWGAGMDVEPTGLDGSNKVVALFSSPYVYQNADSMSAIHEDGSLSVWGDVESGGVPFSTITSPTPPIPVTYISPTTLDGDANDDGDASDTDQDVVYAYHNTVAIAALRRDGSVITWGASSMGGDSSSVQTQIDGDFDDNGDASDTNKDVLSISYTGGAFAALRADGSVITWGSQDHGGDSSSVANKIDGSVKVKAIIGTTQRAIENLLPPSGKSNAFAAIRADGSVITWGSALTGGNSTSVSQYIDGDDDDTQTTVNTTTTTHDVIRIEATEKAFAALRANGSVIVWGDNGGTSGGASCTNPVNVCASLASGVVDISATQTAFAALKSDGSVITWGSSLTTTPAPGDVDGTTKVIKIYSTEGAFAALREDGSVVVWGANGKANNNDVGFLSAKLNGVKPVIDVTGNRDGFSVIYNDGSVYAWGQNVSSDLPPKITHGGYMENNMDLDGDGLANIDELSPCLSIPYSDVGIFPCLSAGKSDTDGDGLWDDFDTRPRSKWSGIGDTLFDANGDLNNDGYPDAWVLPDFPLNAH